MSYRYFFEVLHKGRLPDPKLILNLKNFDLSKTGYFYKYEHKLLYIATAENLDLQHYRQYRYLKFFNFKIRGHLPDALIMEFFKFQKFRTFESLKRAVQGILGSWLLFTGMMLLSRVCC